VVVICLHVDDMLIIRTDLEIVISAKEFLFTPFNMKDLGTTDVILSKSFTQKMELNYLNPIT